MIQLKMKMLISKLIILLLIQLSFLRSVSSSSCEFYKIECAFKIIESIAEPFKRDSSGNIDEKLTRLQVAVAEDLRKLDDYAVNLSNQVKNFNNFLLQMSDNFIKSHFKRPFADDIMRVNDSIGSISFFSRYYENGTAKAWISFSYDSLSDRKIKELDFKDIFFLKYLRRYFEKIDNCGEGFPPQRAVYEAYKMLMATEISRFCIAMFAHELKKIEYIELTDENIFSLTTLSELRIKNIDRIFKDHIEWIPRSFHHCEPKSQGEVKEYVRTMGELYQTMLFREVDSDVCDGQCQNIDVTENFNNFDCELGKKGNYDFCPQIKPCYGRIYKCTTMNEVSVCPGNNSRYRWIRDNIEGKVYGLNKEICENTVNYHGSSSKYECEICRCVCVTSDPQIVISQRSGSNIPNRNSSIYMISTQWMRSSTKYNWVITDVSLKVRCSMLSLQILERPLDKNMNLKSEVNGFSVPCLNDFNPNPVKQKLIDQAEFVMIDSEKFNTINLDDVIVPNGRVVTGVRLAASDKESEKPQHIQLQIESMRYDSSTGELIPHTEEQSWSPEVNTQEIKLNVEDYDIPTRVLEENDIVSKPGSFVRFTLSSLKKDAGQSVVPFIEQKIYNGIVATPLSGVGIYHKKSPTNAGYLAVRLTSIDYGTMIENTLAP